MWGACESVWPENGRKEQNAKKKQLAVLWSAQLQKSGIFKDGINVGFANSVNDSEINLRDVERGVGETQACGSGACAAAIIGRKTRNLNQKIKVNFNEGFLETETDLSCGKVSLTGTANYRAKAVTLNI